MLNALQKHSLEATYNFVFDTLCEDVEPAIANIVLNAIQDEQILNANKALLKQKDVLVYVDQIRSVYLHECPQNRAMGSYPEDEPGWLAWREVAADGRREVKREREGLLSLTNHHIPGTEAVTKQDVINYLDARIAHCQELLKLKTSIEPHSREDLAVAAEYAQELFDFIRVNSYLLEAFKQAILDAQLPGVHPQAAVTYMTTVLNAIRKRVLQDLYAFPDNFCMPAKLVPFIQECIKLNPILLKAKQFEKHTKQLEQEYIKLGEVDIRQVMTHQDSISSNPHLFYKPIPVPVNQQTVASSQQNNQNQSPRSNNNNT